jgi:Antitoxin Xre/MbcA/ParS C-terminal toxin-binding domain/Antitoxin Xre-like helix-turn-helix domain
MTGFCRIMELWGVGNAEARRILGSPPERTFYQWKAGRGGRLPEDVLRRIGYVAGIYKALQILYSDPAQADGWVKKPNRQFGGQTPLQRMAAGDVTDLAAVRAYLDAARAPWS